MNKAFIFDMDGVLIDTESEWEKNPHVSENLYGKEINEKLGSLIGHSIDSIYDKAQSFGYKGTREEHFAYYDNLAQDIFKRAKITPNNEKLITYLKEAGYKIGIVSASPISWVNITISRIGETFDVIISLVERKDLNHKPEPDGYLEAMKILGAKPENTIILEDSNAGIASGKAAGAFVIGLQENLVPGYKQTGADVYAKDIDEVLNIVTTK